MNLCFNIKKPLPIEGEEVDENTYEKKTQFIWKLYQYIGKKERNLTLADLSVDSEKRGDTYMERYNEVPVKKYSDMARNDGSIILEGTKELWEHVAI